MGSKIRKVGRYRRLRSAGQKVSERQIFAQVSDNADYVKALFIFRPLMTLYRGVAGGDWRACKHLRDPSDVKVQPLLKWILSRLCMFMYVHHEYGFRYRGPLTKGKLFQFQPLSRGPAGTRWTICPLFMQRAVLNSLLTAGSMSGHGAVYMESANWLTIQVNSIFQRAEIL